ncbi:MAG: hypothetical protein AAB441_01295 [Patescibacteria group bacterium]
MADELKKQNKQITFRLNINMLVLGLLSILVFVSVVQTVTLASLFTKKQAVTATSVGKSNLPAALKDIPQQVGGC